ncbi:MAG: Rieske (2Fe-2S) protein [Nevskiaceae bacterium]
MSQDWVDAGPASALVMQGRVDVEVDGQYVAIVRFEGELRAFEDRCTHDGEALAEAELEADPTTPCGIVICPRHGAKFCLKTGAALTPPAYEPLKIFAVREQDGRLQVRSSDALA